MKRILKKIGITSIFVSILTLITLGSYQIYRYIDVSDIEEVSSIKYNPVIIDVNAPIFFIDLKSDSIILFKEDGLKTCQMKIYSEKVNYNINKEIQDPNGAFFRFRLSIVPINFQKYINDIPDEYRENRRPYEVEAGIQFSDCVNAKNAPTQFIPVIMLTKEQMFDINQKVKEISDQNYNKKTTTSNLIIVN